MCVCAACHRGWLWLCWGGTEGDLATAHGGPGHSKSVSFGGDPSRLFKRVHYRLVNASAEGETLLTALNSLCTQSPSHSLSHTKTHTYELTHPFSSPPYSPFACVFLLRCVSDCVLSPPCIQCVFRAHDTPISASVSFSWITRVWPSLKLTQYPKVCPFQHWSVCSGSFLCTRVRSYGPVWACLCERCVKCVKQIEGFFEDVFWSLEGDSGVCYCIFRTVFEGLLRVCVCEILIHTISVKQLSSFNAEKRYPECCFNSQ